MKVDQKGHTITIRDTQGNVNSFLMTVTEQYKSFEKSNIIIDLLMHKELSLNDIKLFIPISKQHKKAKKSFVVVADDFDYNAAPNTLTIVPSLLEAHDIIEMDEIERDLGF
ncbi:ribonuclease Z [Flavobacterium sp. P4023]|uniref:Ribonuclease Z n=1 Tax=Flavobacterium flabelliforme TaxID=2816119 RepID=A0ABS5CTG1_9FLAO|nr:ribonuclease Z [Flavobacterium flabelliforme]MBP4141910.1 ribonuclease Z [Flavobacterium flabelliforme]